MTQNNNLSVLPFYTDIQQQNHRRSYAFGAIYPLLAPANFLLPFQIIRPHRKTQDYNVVLNNINTFDGYYLSSTGVVEIQEGFTVIEFDVSNLESKTVSINTPNPGYIYNDGVIALAFDANHRVLSVLSVTDNWYNDIWTFPENTTSIMVQVQSTYITGKVYGAVINTYPIINAKIYDKHGEFVLDVLQYLNEMGLEIIQFKNANYDVIVYPANLPMPTNMFDGIYYLEISDGVQIWYSEMFTIVQDVKPYLKLEWWDAENFVLDSGQIVYQNPAFKNILYLNTELGKPEYQFNEEVEKRDGYFFPEKQISEKTYKCTILAPEYLCDVMRFIRMADYVRITDKYGRIYKVDSFLITPEWQTQGDLASVEIEFETNTVAKKIGRGYIISDIGDYKDDYNDDFNK